MSRKPKEDAPVKRMADLLRQGSTLTELACPACASPLFRLRNGDLWCERCRKKVIVIKEGEEAKVESSAALSSLEAALIAKVEKIQGRIANEENPDELLKLNNVLAGLLENLERLKKSRKSARALGVC